MSFLQTHQLQSGRVDWLPRALHQLSRRAHICNEAYSFCSGLTMLEVALNDNKSGRKPSICASAEHVHADNHG